MFGSQKATNELLKIIKCESGFNPNAKNSESTATGMLQYLEGTWIRYRKMMGKSTNLELRKNWIEVLETTKFVYDKNGWGDWFASNKCHNVL